MTVIQYMQQSCRKTVPISYTTKWYFVGIKINIMWHVLKLQ